MGRSLDGELASGYLGVVDQVNLVGPVPSSGMEESRCSSVARELLLDTNVVVRLLLGDRAAVTVQAQEALQEESFGVDFDLGLVMLGQPVRDAGQPEPCPVICVGNRSWEAAAQHLA